jgi:hypothetical protein
MAVATEPTTTQPLFNSRRRPSPDLLEALDLVPRSCVAKERDWLGTEFLRLLPCRHVALNLLRKLGQSEPLLGQFPLGLWIGLSRNGLSDQVALVTQSRWYRHHTLPLDVASFPILHRSALDRPYSYLQVGSKHSWIFE